MSRVIFSLTVLATLWAAPAVLAVNYTVSTTSEQDMALSWAVGKYNVEKQTQLTNQQYLQTLMDKAMDSYSEGMAKESMEIGREAWSSLSPTDQATICASYANIGKPLPVCP